MRNLDRNLRAVLLLRKDMKCEQTMAYVEPWWIQAKPASFYLWLTNQVLVCGEVLWVFPFKRGRWSPNAVGLLKCGCLRRGSSYLFILHKGQRDIRMSQCSPKTNSCSRCSPEPDLHRHIFEFTHRWNFGALSRNCHVSRCYLSSCRWLRVDRSRLFSWMAGSWSCWFRYLGVHLLTSCSLN